MSYQYTRLISDEDTAAFLTDCVSAGTELDELYAILHKETKQEGFRFIYDEEAGINRIVSDTPRIGWHQLNITWAEHTLTYYYPGPFSAVFKIWTAQEYDELVNKVPLIGTYFLNDPKLTNVFAPSNPLKGLTVYVKDNALTVTSPVPLQLEGFYTPTHKGHRHAC